MKFAVINYKDYHGYVITQEKCVICDTSEQAKIVQAIFNERFGEEFDIIEIKEFKEVMNYEK